MDTIIWLILTVLFIIVEMATVGLVSVWFAAGSAVALIASFFMDESLLWVELLIFLASSGIALLATRPLVRRMREHRGSGKTNFDRIIGMTGVVTEPIDNLAQTGYVSVDGKDWMARTPSDGVTIPEGSHVRVLSIEGAKIIVEIKN